jgi:hypothetical protein
LNDGIQNHRFIQDALKISTLSTSTDDSRNIGIRNFDLEERQRIIEWLSISLPDTSKEHNIARDKHEPTTGSWLLESPQLKTWMESKNSLAWLNGEGK